MPISQSTSNPGPVTRDDFIELQEQLTGLCNSVRAERESRLKPRELMAWMPFILSIISIIVMVVTMRLSINQLRLDLTDTQVDLSAFVSKQETINKQRDVQMSDISVKLAEIQKDILYIRTSLDDQLLK